MIYYDSLAGPVPVAVIAKLPERRVRVRVTTATGCWPMHHVFETRAHHIVTKTRQSHCYQLVATTDLS